VLFASVPGACDVPETPLDASDGGLVVPNLTS
jgi:hypothetical protein